MKTKLRLAALALAVLSTLNSQLSTLHAQGSLTPPVGTPAPVMKSLDQIEARTPVNTLAGDSLASHIITSPGSYYLTSPITGNSGKAGIRIEADNVTLDLNGFTMEAAAGSLAAIQVNLSAGQVNIRNGQLRFWPKGGIISTQAVNCLIENVAIRSVSGPGVQITGPSIVRRVQVNGAVGYGISAKRGEVSECLVETVTAAQAGAAVHGIYTDEGSTLASNVRNVTGNGGLAVGISTALARDCSVDNVQNPSGAAGGFYGTLLTTNNSAVLTGTAMNCRVRNISATGLAAGFYYFMTVRGCLVSDVSSSGNSGLAYGISSLEVADCSIHNIKGAGSGGSVYGIVGIAVRDCEIRTFSNSGSGTATGILLDDGTLESNGGVARGCSVRGGGDYGIYVYGGSTVQNCSVVSAGYGFYAVGNGSVFDSNAASKCSGYGFYVGSGNLAKGNASANNSGDDYSTGQVTITSPATATNPLSNLSIP